MEKAGRRGNRKDYQQRVAFPVEIVSRDGRVRSLSYEEASRLYFRRLTSAPLRYEDAAQVQREVEHCSQRIAQLRRSYIEHDGWGILRELGGEGPVMGALSMAEVVAFVRRALQEEPDGPEAAEVTLLRGGESPEILQIRLPRTGKSWMLSVWPREPVPVGGRQPHQKLRERLLTAPVGEGVEHLVATLDAPDVVGVLSSATEPAHDEGEAEPQDPLGEAMQALLDGRGGEALSALEAAANLQPNRRPLAMAGAIVALLEGEGGRAALLARQLLLLDRPAVEQQDPIAAYLLGLGLAQQGRTADALAHVCAAQRHPLLSLLMSALLADRGSWVQSLAKLPLLPAEVEFPGRSRARQEAERLRRWGQAVLLSRALALAIAVTAAASVSALGGVVALERLTLGLLVALCVGVGPELLIKGWLRRSLRQPARGPLRLVGLELLPKESQGAQ